MSRNTKTLLKYPHYYPFGLMMLGRSWSDGYRFGFNGQEQDDEVYGEGNLNTALFWEYDTRLGRRWNVDPVIKTAQSGYSVFNGNPLIISDYLGNDGVVAVDSKTNTINVSVSFYYDESNERTKNAAENYSSLTNNEWTKTNHTIIDDSGNPWTVTYNIEFIPLSNNEEVVEKLNSDKAANAFETNLTGWGAGQYENRTLNINLSEYTHETMEHEFAHAIGLSHSNFIETTGAPLNELFYTPAVATSISNPYYQDKLNGRHQVSGPSTSYASNRNVAPFEVRLSVMSSLNLHIANNSSSTTVHIKGHDDTSDDEIIK